MFRRRPVRRLEGGYVIMMQKIQMPIGMFNKGSVIYIDFTYDDNNSKVKKRPAIVIDYDQNSTRVIVLKVTTQGTRTQYDYQLKNPKMANLKESSVVRCNHTLTLANGFKCEKHGDLSRQDALAVELLYNQAVYNNALVEA